MALGNSGIALNSTLQILPVKGGTGLSSPFSASTKIPLTTVAQPSMP